VRTDVAKKAADELDRVNGKSPLEMTTAGKSYFQDSAAYLQKIDLQIAKEKIDKLKTKPAFATFVKAVRAIGEDFVADVKIKNQSDLEAKSTPKSEESIEAKARSGTEAANAGAQRQLKVALEDFTKRRQNHLDAVTKISNEAVTILKDIKELHASAKKAVMDAMNVASEGNMFAAKRLATEAGDAAKKAKTAATNLKNAYDDRIMKVFQEDRDLSFLSYKYLQPEQKGAFLEGQKGAEVIFTKAVETGTTVLKSINAMHLLADQAATYASQTEKIANGEDVVKLLQESLGETE
jgi:hypothetical protein